MSLKLNDTPVDLRIEKALRLCAEYADLSKRLKDFVGEANCDYDGHGIQACRKIASEGIIAAIQFDSTGAA